jgi:hypothetical protein
MWIASPDAVLRTQKCTHLKEDSHEVLRLSDEYFEKPLHQGFAAFMTHVVNNHQESSFFAGDEIGSKTVIMTFSNIHTDIRQCLGSRPRCQVEQLSAYKSEEELTEKINHFWQTPEKDLLVLKCKPELDGAHLLLARSIIEEKRNSYRQYLSDTRKKRSKHVCIVVYVQRGETTDGVPWQFSFLCGWRQVFLDKLEAPPVSITEIRGKSIKTLLTSAHIWSISTIAQNQLLWCFTCIKYTRSQRTLETVLHIAKNLFSSKIVSKVIEQLILQSIALEHDQETGNWQVKVACDRQLLVNSSTLYFAMEQFVSRLVQNPLAKIVCFLEKENAWPPHLFNGPNETLTPKLEESWCKFIVNENIFKISDIPEPLGTESYSLANDSLDLRLPFSQVVVRKVDDMKELFVEDSRALADNEDNLDNNGQLKKSVKQQQLEKFSEMITNLVPELNYFTSECSNLYIQDFFDIMTADIISQLSRPWRVSIAHSMFISEVQQNWPEKNMPQLCTLLHTFIWINRERLLDTVRMVDSCEPFVKFSSVASHFQAQPKTDVNAKTVTSVADIDLELEESSKGIESETDHDKNSDEFGDILVTAYCEKMFPSHDIVEKNGGLEPWMRNANLLLSLAFKISSHSPAFHYLRLCVDFVRIVISANATNLSSLYTLHEIGKHLSPEYLDHKDSFEMITKHLFKPLEEEFKDQKDKREALEKFLALFYARCIDTNVDTSNARPIVEHVLSLTRPELVMMMSAVVLRLLEVDEQESPGIFIDMITNPNSIEECPCLQNIEEVLNDHCSNGLVHRDSHPTVMICDLIQGLLQFNFSVDDINSSDCEVLMIARSATTLLSPRSEDACSLRVLSAVAFLRAFITMLAKFVAGNPSALNEESAHIHVMTDVHALLKESSLQMFFIKQLHKHASLIDIQKWFSQKNALSPIELSFNERNQDKAKFTAVFKYPEYEEAKAAYWIFLEKNDSSSIQDFMTKCNNPKYAFALLGLLIEMVFLKRAVRKLKDTEERLVDWFAKNVTSFPPLYQQLLLRIIQRPDFSCPQLNLSPESSVEDVEMALFVLHIACVVATGALSETLPLYCYFTNPAKFEPSCILAHCKEDVRSIFEDQPSLKESVCATCQCGLRLAFESNVSNKTCPYCGKGLDVATSSADEMSATHLKFSKRVTIPEWDRCTENMSPAVYRALHLIVKSSFYAGIALGNLPEEGLSMAAIDLDCDSCFKNMKRDLETLMVILRCKENVAIKIMHLVLEKSSALIRCNSQLRTNDCSTPTMRREWESMFSQLTETVFLNARETSKEVKEMMKLQQTENNDENTLECRILELDSYPQQPAEQDQQLKRLFRTTKKPTLQDFRSAFLFSPKEVQAKHLFLKLFFEKYSQLLVIGDLHHILKWSRRVSSALTHRVSRKDAQFRSINDFISGHLLELNRSDEERESLNKEFDNFKKGWNKIRSRVNKVLKNEEEIPRLKETDCVAYCLTESDCGIYLQTAIEILVSDQNSILDGIISLSSQQHPALSFLKKQNCSGVMSTSIQHVKETEIMHFQWSDDLLQHARNNLEYGKGQEIVYDFERMEMELAAEIASGKCFLTGSLNKFIFAKEFFHSCGPLLTDIRSLVRQKPSLPEEVLRGVSDLKEKRIKVAQGLLQHIEVLIYLLKRKLKGFKEDMTLEELAEKWSSILPSPFPVDLLPKPRSSIKIEHVVALYMALEDVLADGAIEGLADKFRDELPGDVKETIDVMIKKEIDQLKPHNFLKTLRRLVFRYLSTETEAYCPEEIAPLQSCLTEPSLWFPLQPPHPDEISRDITLKYIHSIIKYLEELEKVRFPCFRIISVYRQICIFLYFVYLQYFVYLHSLQYFEY